MRNDAPLFTLSVAANLLKLHPRTLMLYERASLVSPHRTITNRRLFSPQNLQDLQFVKFLTQDKGANLRGARIILDAIGEAEKQGINIKGVLFPDFRPTKLL